MFSKTEKPVSYFLNLLLAVIVLSSIASGGYAQSSQSASGSTYANVAIAGSTTQWANITNAVSSNDVYSTPTANLPSNGNYTDYLHITNFSFSIAAGSTITGIAVNVERSDANGKSKDERVRIIKGGTIGATDKSVNPSWNATDAVQAYGGSSDLWGETWTVADINATNFGFAFAVRRSGGGPQATLAKIDQVFITVYYNTPLPVQLAFFNAKLLDDAVHINWQTLSEIDSDYFIVEKSADAISFFELTRVEAAGHSTSAIHYNVIDINPVSGKNYYRLAQVDFNGSTSRSQIIEVESNVKEPLVKIFPNPAKEFFTVAVSGSNYFDLAFADVKGRVCANRSRQLNSTLINSRDFENGVYVLKIMSGNKVYCRNIIVSH